MPAPHCSTKRWCNGREGGGVRPLHPHMEGEFKGSDPFDFPLSEIETSIGISSMTKPSWSAAHVSTENS